MEKFNNFLRKLIEKGIFKNLILESVVKGEEGGRLGCFHGARSGSTLYV